MKSLYYQFVNFIQNMPALWFLTIVLALLCVAFVLLIKFYKIYNGTQKSFEKISFFVWALIAFAVLVYLVYLRK